MKTNNRNTFWLASKTKEWAGILLFYITFSFIYHSVLFYIDYSNTTISLLSIFNLRFYWYTAGLQYALLFIGSLGIWYCAIKLLRNLDLKYKIIAVGIAIPIVVFFARNVRYMIVDHLGIFRLQGSGTIWDLYIPSLFLLFQFGCYFAYTYFNETRERLKLENELRQTTLKSELAALKAQINPHFLYNTFNTINASIPQEQEKTRKLIAELSDLFRYQLRASKADLVPLGDELTFIRNYLNIEKARFEDRLKVSIDVEDDLLNYQIPPMILQPLVENALNHGLSSLIEGGEITIQVKKLNDRLHFVIADTGVGISDKSATFKQGTGLSNTRIRLEKMYNSNFKITDNDPRGLKISFDMSV